MSKATDLLFQRNKKHKKSFKKTYLIFCEWETEKHYFEEIKQWVKSITIEPRQLNNKSFQTIAKEMKKVIDQLVLQWKSYDRVYCIFDNNNLPRQDFEQWLSIMKKNNIHLIYSNKCFEVWILMHYLQYNRKVQNSAEYERELQQFIPWYAKPYKWLYHLTKSKIRDAIGNSKSISRYENFSEVYSKEPYTDMRQIIEDLMQYIES